MALAYDSSVDRGSRAQRDWAGMAIAFLLLGWMVVSSFGVHWITWVTEQFFILMGQDLPTWVWPAAAAGHGLLVLVPSLPLAAFWRGPRYRAVFRTCALASLLIFALLPVRLVPANAGYIAVSLQILGAGLYLLTIAAIIGLWRWRGGAGFLGPRPPYLPALLPAPLLAYGWIAWGALGSGPDVLLNVLAALLFGCAVGLVCGHFLLRPLRQTGSGLGWDILLGGSVTSACLVVMSSGFGYNGQQLLLMAALSALGWALIGVSHFGRDGLEEGWLALALLAGLSAAAPLLFADPDELVLVLNLESRDVLQWSMRATLTTMAMGAALGLLFILFRRRWSRRELWSRRRNRLILVGGTIATWAMGLLIYVLAGQPGFYGDRLLVILARQADLSPATTITDYEQRRRFVYDTLVHHAGETQADLRAVLDRLGIDYTPYYLVNAIEVEAGPLVRLWLSARPEVDRILHSPVLRPLPAPIPSARGHESAPAAPQWNLATIGADRVWREFGVTGEGIVVGQSDSGVQWDHPELRASYRGQGGDHDYHWFDPWYHTVEPRDIGGHGTHTLGSVLGKTVGVAPGATWYGCVNLARNLANPALYLDCMQFMLAPFPLQGDPFTDGRPELGAHVINNSWVCPELEGCDPDALVHAVRTLRAAGTFVVSSAGNDGQACETVDSPIALYDEAYSVGAVDSSGALALFSSRGPVTADGSGRTKPDIVAPGLEVLSAYPGDTYELRSGTSMAGPHVAGVVALMWSANPSLIGDIERTEAILAETAQPYDYEQHGYPNCAGDGNQPNNAVGYGIVDAYAAVRRALEED